MAPTASWMRTLVSGGLFGRRVLRSARAAGRVSPLPGCSAPMAARIYQAGE